jgi:glycosyltransferase involved in cell wall biosynthesis
MVQKRVVSIITPCFNEEQGVVACYEAIREIFDSDLSQYELEHIFCDNASTDKTVVLLKEIAARDTRVKIIVNSRNFGILKNTFNGVLHASGDGILLFMPVDMQDPPDLIPKFVGLWETGYEIVYGVRAERDENVVIAGARKAYYRLLSYLTYVDYPCNVGDFQLIDRCVLDAMKKIDDAQPFMRLMTFDCGFRSIGVEYTWRARKHGVSRNRLRDMFDQGLNGLVSFSVAPLRIALVVGFLLSGCSLLYAISVFGLALFGFVESQAGIPTIIVALFFFGGVQLFFLGVLGEYVLAIFSQVRRRPLVIERERVNFDRDVH